MVICSVGMYEPEYLQSDLPSRFKFAHLELTLKLFREENLCDFLKCNNDNGERSEV